MKNLKKGQKVKVIANTCSHNYQIGKIYEIYTLGNSCGYNYQLIDTKTNIIGNYISESDFQIEEQTKEMIEEEIALLKQKIALLKQEISEKEMMLKWIEETKSETFDENEFKVWQTLTTIENSELSKIEKARLIAKLIS